MSPQMSKYEHSACSDSKSARLPAQPAGGSAAWGAAMSPAGTVTMSQSC